MPISNIEVAPGRPKHALGGFGNDLFVSPIQINKAIRRHWNRDK